MEKTIVLILSNQGLNSDRSQTLCTPSMVQVLILSNQGFNSDSMFPRSPNDKRFKRQFYGCGAFLGFGNFFHGFLFANFHIIICNHLIIKNYRCPLF